MSPMLPECLNIPPEELGAGVTIKFRTCGGMGDVADDMARVMLESIETARPEGRGATLIVPVVLVDQFPLLACHKSRLQRCGDPDFAPLEEQMIQQAEARDVQAGVAAAEALRAHLAWKRTRAW